MQKNFRSVLLISMTLLLTFNAPWFDVSAQSYNQPSSLTLHLSVEQQAVDGHMHTVAHLIINNEGDDVVILPSLRGLSGIEHVWIRDIDGNWLQPVVSSPKSTFGVFIKPHATVTEAVDVSKLYDLRPGVSYDILLSYRIGSIDELLQSNIVRFTTPID